MFKWIALSVIGVVLLGLHLTNGYLTQVIASNNRDNTTFLIAQYKKHPGVATTAIKKQAAVCVTEEVGENIPGLNKLFGEIVLFTVKNIEKSESELYRGYVKMMAQQERTLIALAKEASPAKEKAIREMFVKHQEKPLALMSCVARKMQKTSAA